MRGNRTLRLGNQGYAFSRPGAGLALAAVLLAGWATEAMAQSGGKPRPTDSNVRRTALSREEEKQWIDDLSHLRMESSRSRIDKIDKNSRRRPTTDDLDTPTPEMKKIRPLITEFAQISSLLKSQLSDDLSQNQSLRSLLNDALDVAAQAVVLSKRAKDENDHHVLLNDLQDIDAAWGELSYRLAGTRRLSSETQDHIKNMDDIASEIRQELDIGQQVNHKDLATKAVSLATDLENLMDDITSDLGRTADARRMSADTSKAHQQVLNIADLADGRADLETIVEEYKRFQELWYPQAASLQSKNRNYLERSLRRIAKDDGEMSRLLLMPQRFDKSQVVYLTNALRKDIDEFMATPIKSLLSLPKSGQALASADQFYGVCDNFVDTVNHQDEYEDIVDSFRHIEAADRDFLKAFSAVDDDETAASLAKITQTLDALRVAIQVDREDFNRPAASALAAKVANLSDSIDVTARRWLAHDRQSFGQDCLDETDALVQAAGKLHDTIINGASVVKIQQETEDLYQTWRKVYSYLVKCQSDERPTLGRAASQLTPALIELRTLVAQ